MWLLAKYEVAIPNEAYELITALYFCHLMLIYVNAKISNIYIYVVAEHRAVYCFINLSCR